MLGWVALAGWCPESEGNLRQQRRGATWGGPCGKGEKTSMSEGIIGGVGTTTAVICVSLGCAIHAPGTSFSDIAYTGRGGLPLERVKSRI